LDIGVAIKKPFSNIGTLIIGIILSLIPIVNFLTIPGYLLRLAKKSMGGDDSLPKFEDFGDLVVSSIKAIVVSIVYYIVYAIIVIILLFIPLIGPVLALIWGIVFGFVFVSALLTLAKSGEIGDCFKVKKVAERAKKMNFIIAVIVGSIITGIIMAVIFGILVAVGVGGALITSGAIDPAALTGLASAGLLMIAILVIVGYILQIFFVFCSSNHNFTVWRN